jgi:hypothetical protein
MQERCRRDAAEMQQRCSRDAQAADKVLLHLSGEMQREMQETNCTANLSEVLYFEL